MKLAYRSDFVADLRAATHSNAAELAVPDQDALRQMLDSISTAIVTAVSRNVHASRRHLQMLRASHAMQNPMMNLERKRSTLQLLSNRMISLQERYIADCRKQFLSHTAKLDALSPLKVLTRGYAMVQSGEETVVRSVKQVSVDENVYITLSDGTLQATVTEVKECEL